MKQQCDSLPKIFDTFYDIKTKRDLDIELEYLEERLRGILRMCEDYGVYKNASIVISVEHLSDSVSINKLKAA